MPTITTAHFQEPAATIGDSFNRWISAPQVDHAEVIASCENFGLRGVDFQLGMNAGCHIDNVMIRGHYVGIQLNDDSLDVKIRDGADWVDVRNPPGSIWIHPEGLPFSVHHTANSRWAGIIIPQKVLNDICRQQLALRQSHGIADPLICDLLSSIIHQTTDKNQTVSRNLALSEAMVRALILALGCGHADVLPAKGGISLHHLRQLREWLEENISGSVRVDQMAALLGFSPAHFSREFKRSTNSTPWDYVTDMRVDRACHLLTKGEPISAVVGRCGFSDHSHLSRMLRARRGVSPSEIRRQAKRLPR